MAGTQKQGSSSGTSAKGAVAAAAATIADSKIVARGGAGEGRFAPGAFTLVHAVGGKRSQLFPPTRLMNPVTYLGRTTGNDIILGSDNVSRRHAKLVVNDHGITVHDLDSHNGIFLNGKKVRSTAINVGDLLYVADVCIELKKSPDFDDSTNATSLRPATTHEEITGEEDPAARSLATLLRATELIAAGDEEAWAIQAIELCRELTEATHAVLVTNSGGSLDTPVVLQPESSKKGEVPVLWPVVHKAIDEGVAQFSADMKRHPITRDDAVLKSDVGACMCVPIAADGSSSDGAIYLARPSPGQVFTERELEAVAAVAHLFALRRRPAASASSVVDVEPHGDVVAARAKAEAAEEKLREAQSDVRSLTERIHGLEAEALKLRQQIEVEKQNALEARREADRGRSEADKLEKGLHKTDEDVKKLKDALVRSEEERQKLKENLKAVDEDRKGKGSEIEKLRELVKQGELDREKLRTEIADHVRSELEKDDELKAREGDLERERAEHDATRREAADTREGLEKAVAEQLAAAESLKQAMRATVPPMLADHVENAAVEGRPLVTEVTTGTTAALYVTLFGFDGWALSADAATVKRRLDHYCNSIALRARANGGRVQQVLGQSHLVVFPADAASVRAAVRCALELAAIVPTEDGVGVLCALHVGASSSGFFGEGDSATLVEAGEALLVARGVAALAHEPTFFATQAVQKLVAGDPAFAFALAGPAALVGGPRVVLYEVTAVGEAAGGGA